MSHKAYLRRCSISEASLNSELKSYQRNKLEERKLAMTNDKWDKDKASRRKSVHSEKQQLNKDLEENVMKRTPSLEEYLDKSQTKYSTWKEREREKLDRRYRSLHRAYMKDLKSLGLDDYDLEVAEKKHRETESEATRNADKETDNLDGKHSKTGENNDTVSEEEALLALEKLNLEMNKRRCSVGIIGEPKYHARRRGSTGSIDLAEFTKLRSLHLALTTVTEDSQTAQDSTEQVESEEIENDKPVKGNENSNEEICKSRYPSVTFENNDDDISAEDLIVRPKRRTTLANFKPTTAPVSVPVGARLDRRPSLPHNAIPYNYGT